MSAAVAPLLAVVHEDDALLVVNKPAGLVCHPTKAGPTSSLIGRVRLYLGHDEGRLVHRLDRETSGLVVIAKTATVARDVGGAFARDGVEKRYVALVHGSVQGDGIRIDAPIGRDEASAVAIKDAVRADGARAVTRVTPRREIAALAGRFSLVDVVPETGRKHQIRIHLAHIGHPIVGDKIYGGDERRYLRLVSGELTDGDRSALLLEHHALHAIEIGLEWNGRRWRWSAGDEAWQAWLQRVQ